MLWKPKMIYGKPAASGNAGATRKCLMMVGVLAFLPITPAIAQNSELQEKVAAVKQNIAENKQRLQQYQWTETTQLTFKGRSQATVDKPVSLRS